MIQVKNAVICDGTGKEPFSGELLIDGEKLAEVSPIPFGELDAEVLDARGMAVTPGFIDAHRHCDLAALYDPEFSQKQFFPSGFGVFPGTGDKAVSAEPGSIGGHRGHHCSVKGIRQCPL